MKTAVCVVTASAFGILSSALIAAGKQGETLMLLAGSPTALAGFEKAAKSCAVHGVSRIPAERGEGTWIRVAGTSSQLGSKPFTCIGEYMMNHMSGRDALSFIGNAAR